MKLTNRLLALFSIALATLYCVSVNAEIHKWVDEKGVTHYSEFAPPQTDSNVEQIEVEKTPEDTDQKYQQMKDRVSKENELEKEEKRLDKMSELEKKEYKIIKKNCSLARKNVKVLQDKSNRKFKDSKGNVTFFDDETRAAKIKQAQDYIDKNCTDIK
ncbi:MAG: DUF4124 domain-containing protein [Gammaproteobacteria bacterium]|nr:MAG: DUF4124 domain-containing protein [Gammaproteobacteria bacterium]